MNSNDRRRLLLIIGVLVAFLLPLIINGPLNSDVPAIPLGLDLSGGVDVQIQVDLDYTARQLLNELKYPINNDMRSLRTQGSQLVLTPEDSAPGLHLTLNNPAVDAGAVQQALQEYVDDGTLRPIDGEALRSNRGVVLQLATEYLNDRADSAIESAARVVKERVDALGVAQSDVRVEGRDRIRVQLPGQQDPNRVINNLVRPATLEFRLVHPEMDGMLPALITPEGELRPGANIPEGYEILPGDPDSEPEIRERQYIGRSEEFGLDTFNYEVAWYLVKTDPEVWGEHLRTVRAEPGGQFGAEIVVSFELNGEGTRRFRETTESHVGERMAILLERRVRSAPNIREAIPYGRGQISGNFSFEEARDLENILRTGALPARLVPGEVSVVGASLGEDSIHSGMVSALLGAGLVIAFMLFYYSTAGVVAVVAVLTNVFLVLGTLSMIRATLTLPGIAGIILTIGMAVDANVLIFERIREELRSGKNLRHAITTGFSRAFSAILDANITTLITALVLLQFGFGPIRGFALTMTFGIVATLFTGLFVTQVLMSVIFNMTEKLALGRAHFLTDPKYKFMQVRRAAFLFSAVLILASLADLVVNRGPNLGVDFTGGVQVELASDVELDRADVEQALVDGGFAAPRVQTIDRSEVTVTEASGEATRAAASNFLVRIAESEMLPGNEEGDTIVRTEEALVTAVEAENPGATISVSQARGVSAETGARLQWTAIGIAVVAALGIFVYVAVRFDSIYGAAALVALIHDVFITLGVVTLMNVDLSLDVVAALLTILGYSLNDTIVVFDRIRENRHQMEGRDLGEVINLSINQMLSRTLITSGTTILVLLAMLVLGGPGVHDFALTLFIGFMIGTYSSIFIASPMLYWRVRRRQLVHKRV